MLARYRIVRGVRPADDPLPDGVRRDTRKHTRHIVAPTEEMVRRFLADRSDAAFEVFRSAYLELLRRRFENDRSPFDKLAELARQRDVYLGCNCPTVKQPDVRRCHTQLALGFFRQAYPDLEIRTE